jgi:large subunit ribosomal protein L17
MRHNKKFNHLGRKSAHRKALLANMACSLIKHKRIETTLAKAKALRTYVEPLITKSKAANNAVITPIVKQVKQKQADGTYVTVEKKVNINSSTAARRVVFSYLKDKEAVKELFSAVAPKVANRPGGYTRVLKTGFRLGDAAEMAMIELVDFNESALAATGKKETKKSTRRSRRKSSSDTKAQTPEVKTPEVKKQKLEVKAEEEAKVINSEEAKVVEETEAIQTEADEPENGDVQEAKAEE